MANKWNTEVDDSRNSGTVRERLFTQLVFDAEFQTDRDLSEFDEIVIRVNRKVFARMHPSRAMRLGIGDFK
jgi:hypothetical protein